ncbi:GntR family transcriptional regulator [Herbiconiux ginsengi]|uniref:Transcriptional regulator, GntR family n=1 Tax=Herbiconiux ginsengi TaxID=381665 RepID=A0A1H3U3V5_9MICO|nr:GntR family transcriptional regulator [Herbiconiux ginsengi]SDZ56987.1 transcriptional regulator, GntR family [Herbiconiux ginsengi]
MQSTKIERHAAPLRQQVVRLLREDILEGVLAPGERLLENAMCDSYGVSRTVIREALRQLETESLITMLPNRGPIVTVLTKRDIQALYEVRRVLEGLAGELFARRASPEQASAMRALIVEMEETYLRGTVHTREESKEQFYDLLLAGAGNPVLENDLRGVHTRIGLFRRYAFVDEHRVALSMEELRQIAREIAEHRDPDAARRACEHHIQLAGELAILEYTKRLHQSDTDSRAESATEIAI